MARSSLSDRIRSRLQSHVLTPFERRVGAPLRRLRNSGRRYRPLFVTGASGGGTSLLAVSLAQNSECAGLVYECDEQISHRSFLHVPTLARFASVAEYERFIQPRSDWSVEQGRADVQAMLRAWARGAAGWVVAKGPDIHLVRVAFLHRCFPDAAFVAIFRDPVANVEGLRRKWRVFGQDTLDACIGFYRSIHEHYLEAAAALPGRALLVDYVDLVTNPDATLGALRERLDLAPGRGRISVPDTPDTEGKGIRNVRGSRIEMVKDADPRARARLAPDEAEKLEAALAPLHARMRRLAVHP